MRCGRGPDLSCGARACGACTKPGQNAALPWICPTVCSNSLSSFLPGSLSLLVGFCSPLSGGDLPGIWRVLLVPSAGEAAQIQRRRQRDAAHPAFLWSRTPAKPLIVWSVPHKERTHTNAYNYMKSHGCQAVIYQGAIFWPANAQFGEINTQWGSADICACAEISTRAAVFHHFFLVVLRWSSGFY